MAKNHVGQEGPGDGGGKLVEVHADNGASPEGVQVLGPESGVWKRQGWEVGSMYPFRKGEYLRMAWRKEGGMLGVV